MNSEKMDIDSDTERPMSANLGRRLTPEAKSELKRLLKEECAARGITPGQSHFPIREFVNTKVDGNPIFGAFKHKRITNESKRLLTKWGYKGNEKAVQRGQQLAAKYGRTKKPKLEAEAIEAPAA